MFLPRYPLRRLTIFGVDESDPGAKAVADAASMALAVKPDPQPGRDAFICRYQYSFRQQGFLSLMLTIAYRKGSPDERTFQDWLKECSHSPSDDLAQTVDKAAAGLFDRFMCKLLFRVADRDGRLRWKDA